MRPTLKARKIGKSIFLWSVPYLGTSLSDPFYLCATLLDGIFLDALASLGFMSESQWVMFLRFGQILGVSSEYVQSMLIVGSE